MSIAKHAKWNRGSRLAVLSVATLACCVFQTWFGGNSPTDFRNTAFAAEARSMVMSGRMIGQMIPSFFVRAVTGPLRNKSVCYVCRNGSRPVVMVLIQELDPELKPLLKEIDTVVDKNRATGLRSFGVFIAEEPSKAAPKLQTLAFDQKLRLPLTVATGVVAAPACQNVHSDAAVTVVLYKNQRVVQKFAYRTGELNSSQVSNIIASVKQLAGIETAAAN